MGDAQDLPLPIEVLQAQGRDFPGAEAIHRQQHQQGAIADVDGPVPFGRGKQPLHVVPGRTDRQTFMGEDSRSHDRGRQPFAAPATSFREPEESTESRRPSLNGDPRIPLVANLLGQQFIHLGHGQRLEPKTGFLDLREELVNRPTVVRDRSAATTHVLAAESANWAT